MCAGTTDKNAEIVRFFCRHLVSLFIVYRPKNSAEADKPHHFLACSGTLIELHGRVFCLTAGHVLKKIEEQLHRRDEWWPIFGFGYKGSELRYWIVALQSSWYQSRRIIFGCPLPILASLLSDWISDALSAQRRANRKRRAERVASKQPSLKRNRLKRK